MGVLFLVVLGSFIATSCNEYVDTGVGRIWTNDEIWARSLMHDHLVNMTLEILKDTKNRLSQTNHLLEEHRHTIGYDLGTISAGILERFILMLKIYRKYSNIPAIKRDDYWIDEVINVLSVVQGAYNEIILEKGMFYNILKKYEYLDPEHLERARMNRLRSKKPSWFHPNGQFMFRRAGAWKPADILGVLILSRVFGDEMDLPDFVEKIKDDISPTLYARFGSKSKEYDRDFVKRLVSGQRNHTVFNGTRKSWANEEWLYIPDDVFWHEPYYNKDHRGHACILMQVNYKMAMNHIRYYYDLRIIYVDNKEYEIGYLTHEIIYRYQIMLELYHFIEKRYWHRKNSNVAPTSLIVYFYANILEESQAIIHLCNMLHEIEAKYKFDSGIKSLYDSAFKDSIDDSTKPKNITLSKNEMLERYLRMQKRREIRKRREGKRQRKLFARYGLTTAHVPKYQTKKSRYPLNYGWSVEDWPPK